MEYPCDVCALLVRIVGGEPNPGVVVASQHTDLSDGLTAVQVREDGELQDSRGRAVAIVSGSTVRLCATCAVEIVPIWLEDSDSLRRYRRRGRRR